MPRMRMESSRLLFLYCRKVTTCPPLPEEEGRRASLCTLDLIPPSTDALPSYLETIFSP